MHHQMCLVPLHSVANTLCAAVIEEQRLQVASIRRGMDVGMLLTGVPLVVMTRALNIYPLAFLLNKGEQFSMRSARQLVSGMQETAGSHAVPTQTLHACMLTTAFTNCIVKPITCLHCFCKLVTCTWISCMLQLLEGGKVWCFALSWLQAAQQVGKYKLQYVCTAYLST